MRTAVFTAAVMIFVISAAGASAWSERPDADFHAHPLTEISESLRTFARARVKRVLREASRRSSGLIRAEVSSGIHTGVDVYANMFYDPGSRPLKEEDNIIISFPEDEFPGEVMVDSRDRIGGLVLLLIVFAVSAFLVGGRKNLYSLASLAAGVAVCLMLLNRLLLYSLSPFLYMSFAAAAVIILTMSAIGGFSRKTLAAFAGALSGLAAAALAGYLFYYSARITGFHLEEIQLLNYSAGYSVNFFRELMTGMLLLGSAGVVMDTSVSVASSMSEIRKNSPEMSSVLLRTAGVSIGRDISATMASTLILAYMGGYLGFMLVSSLHIRSFVQLANMQFFHVGLYTTLFGTCAFLISANVTAWVGSKIL